MPKFAQGWPVLIGSFFLGALFASPGIAGFSVIPTRTGSPDPVVQPRALPPAETPTADAAEDAATELRRQRDAMIRVQETLQNVAPGQPPTAAPSGAAAPGNTTQWAPQAQIGDQTVPFTAEQIEASEEGSAGGGAGMQMPSPEALKQIQGLMSTAAVQHYMKLFNNPDFMAGMMGLAQSPNHLKMLVLQITLMFALAAFKNWRQEKHSKWIGRAWVRFYCFLLFLVFSVGILPNFVYGRPYRQMVSGFVETISKK